MASFVYIARDIERALGKIPKDDYFIITNESPYALEIKLKFPDNIFLIKNEKILDTFELLSMPEVQDTISRLNANILVFKNTTHIESLCKEKGWKLLNPSAELGEKIENKISQISWLGELSSLLPPNKVSIINDIVWGDKPIVIQWSHGHTGDGTVLVANESDLNALKEKFPYREARVTNFIKGPMFTVNIVVTSTINLLGNISYQITGMLPFTENLFSTIGNDWSVPHTIIDEGHIQKFEKISEQVAGKMQKDGWRGLFGIDVILDEERNELYLIEINARQPASTTFESELETKMKIEGVPGITVFDAHLSALTGVPITTALIPINDGAQILQRVTRNTPNFDIKKLIENGYKIIIYGNTKLNADLLRIQSAQGIMLAHNKFNKRGKEIVESLVV
jgi:predicted ATP-grasp superfamily ATP-dependent carboligase